MSSVRVLLADDHEMVRHGLAQILEESEGIEIVGQASGGREALRLAESERPDVVVLDYTMPDLDGAEVSRQLLEAQPGLGIIILTMHENVHYALHALQAGAMGYVVKSDAPGELVRAVNEVRQGRSYVSPRLSGAVARQLSQRGAPGDVEQLSRREFELLRLLAQGLPLKECAATMGIVESTASTYRQRLMNKLQLDSTADLIRYAIEQGIDS